MPLGDDPFWYKDAVIYEAPVRSFRDSNGDGVGDFRGLMERLDYLQDLGVTALWLLPFYPSPLRDDGYDIADYTRIHPAYGTLDDFRLFLDEAHQRGLRVITELVVNHTSDQHPWFQRARRAPPGSPERDFYVWSDGDGRFREARIIFKDFESSNWTWDPVAKAYFWHRFYSHQPDLNYDNPRVQDAVFEVLDYWLGMGVDGLRLDAVPYLYEREGTTCENLPETHAFLKRLRRHVDEKFPGRMLLAEANQWPEEAAAYFGDGDECHMAFHFPVMPRLFMAIRLEDRLPIVDILQQTPAIPAAAQWAMFLRNHDELTLEMVTDEDRDYMYRVYARDPRSRINLGIRRRLAPLLENHRAKIELMHGLLFSLPGTPVLYYGDELGMGDNIYLGDRNGVRTPMQWSGGRNAGFSHANPQALYLPAIIDPEYHYASVNVEVQQNNPHSLLWWTKHAIHLRKQHPAFGRGQISFLAPDNHRVLAFVRSYVGTDVCDAEDILVVANLSRFPQYVELDLSGYAGRTPVELRGRSDFPVIGDRPYLLTLGSYACLWFLLRRRPTEALAACGGAALPTLDVRERWDEVFAEPGRAALGAALAAHLPTRPWFLGPRPPDAVRLLEAVPAPTEHGAAYLTLVQAEYDETETETYFLPLAFAAGGDADRVAADLPGQTIAALRIRPRAGRGEPVSGVLYDPLGEASFSWSLLEAVLRRQRLPGALGQVTAELLPGADGESAGPAVVLPDPALARGEHHNTTVLFGDRYALKAYRRLEEGVHPAVEVGRALAASGRPAPVAPLVGVLEHRRRDGQPTTLGVVHRFIPNQGEGWRRVQDALGHFFEEALARQRSGGAPDAPALTTREMLRQGTPTLAEQLLGPRLEVARLLGRRIAELHLALAALDGPDFAPEPFTALYQRSLYQSFRSQTRRAFVLLRKRLHSLPDEERYPAQRLIESEEVLIHSARDIFARKIDALRMRCHGDFNLRKILYTGKDITIIDLEGQAARPLIDRRRKYTPLRDVAFMLRSFHYAALYALHHGGVRREDQPALEPWARFWLTWVSAAFLKAYQEAASAGQVLPADPDDFDMLLEFYLFKRAINELRYELGRGEKGEPAIPVQGLLQLLDARGPEEGGGV
jgi:maltose alpha-D-glucosyltransferase/alpha-amylase